MPLFSYTLWLKTCAVRFQSSRRLKGILIFIEHLTLSYILLHSFYFDHLRVHVDEYFRIYI